MSSLAENLLKQLNKELQDLAPSSPERDAKILEIAKREALKYPPGSAARSFWEVLGMG